MVFVVVCACLCMYACVYVRICVRACACGFLFKLFLLYRCGLTLFSSSFYWLCLFLVCVFFSSSFFFFCSSQPLPLPLSAGPVCAVPMSTILRGACNFQGLVVRGVNIFAHDMSHLCLWSEIMRLSKFYFFVVRVCMCACVYVCVCVCVRVSMNVLPDIANKNIEIDRLDR